VEHCTYSFQLTCNKHLCLCCGEHLLEAAQSSLALPSESARPSLLFAFSFLLTLDDGSLPILAFGLSLKRVSWTARFLKLRLFVSFTACAGYN